MQLRVHREGIKDSVETLNVNILDGTETVVRYKDEGPGNPSTANVLDIEAVEVDVT